MVQIVGLPNWRLEGLQQRIRAGRLPSFRALTSSTSQEFYRECTLAVGMARRYLLYHLQEQGLLREYYRRFRAARRVDPSGYATLQQTLGSRHERLPEPLGALGPDLKFGEPQ